MSDQRSRPGSRRPPDLVSGPSHMEAQMEAPTPPFGFPTPTRAWGDAPPRRGRGGAARPGASTLLVPALLGVGVAVVLGVYGRVHEPTSVAISVAGFSAPGYVKAWLATVAAVLALVQVITAADMWGRFGRGAPGWAAPLHRWAGRLAVLVSVPVVVHCLYAFGFGYDSPRTLVHSLVGCLFYGAFATKMLSLIRRDAPAWTLPVLGGLVFTGLVMVWLTSALWLFTTKGVHL
jgi:hypothetical protein